MRYPSSGRARPPAIAGKKRRSIDDYIQEGQEFYRRAAERSQAIKAGGGEAAGVGVTAGGAAAAGGAGLAGPAGGAGAAGSVEGARIAGTAEVFNFLADNFEHVRKPLLYIAGRYLSFQKHRWFDY
ncbi:MAG: hypothetical protein AB1556_12390 [Bacillota bacterium]